MFLIIALVLFLINIANLLLSAVRNSMIYEQSSERLLKLSGGG
jgi:hypothetical protein